MLFRGSWPATGLVLSLLSALCVNAFLDPQPIGIDFGLGAITAVYAHSADNITAVAFLSPADDSAYRLNMLKLQAEFIEDNLHLRLSRPQTTRETLTGLARSTFAKASTRFPLLESPTIQDNRIVRWAADLGYYIFDYVIARLETQHHGRHKRLTPEEIIAGFKDVLNQVKAIALENHDIDITSATFAVPDFFDRRLSSLLSTASKSVGIHTFSAMERRSVMATLTSSYGPESHPDLRYLVIDQGEFHCTFRTTYRGTDAGNTGKGIREHYLPVDMHASATINRDLANRLVERSETLQKQVARGTRQDNMWPAVRRVRFLIRDDIEKEFLGEDLHEDRHLEEYPLGLKGSGFDEANDLVLTWEEIQEVENAFVDKFSATIFNYLVVMRRSRNPEAFKNDLILERVDKVVILTDHMDGRLLKRAVQKAIGDGIEIIGGSIHDIDLAANGAALQALKWITSSKSPRSGHTESTHYEL